MSTFWNFDYVGAKTDVVSTVSYNLLQLLKKADSMARKSNLSSSTVSTSTTTAVGLTLTQLFLLRY
jgi:hypothetical protein